MPYADASTQTLWAGLANSALVRPELLLTAPDTTTPPDDMLTQKMQPAMPPAHTLLPAAPRLPSLLERRRNNSHLARGILVPGSPPRLGDGLAASPRPALSAALSPLPAANKLHAGHTPLIPGSPSPINDDLVVAEESIAVGDNYDDNDDFAAQDQDLALTGPLSLPTLPTNPVDGTVEHIVLSDLDRALERVAQEQQRFGKLKGAPSESAPSPISALPPAPDPTGDESESQTRKSSADSRSSTVSFVNGVPLKSPPLNFGVPMGQLPGRS